LALRRLENTPWFRSRESHQFCQAGYVVFTYDMVGQNDTNQVPHDWLDSRQDLWNIGSSMGIHLWNSIRATDFLTSLPDVDPNRIAATGASAAAPRRFSDGGG
jgi:dienelactone hydrolase